MRQAVLTEAVRELATVGLPVAAACRLTGLPRATFYRLDRGYRHYRPVPEPLPQARRRQPAALTPGERAEILAVLESDEYADLSVVQTYWRAFDAGAVACSARTFYRVAGAAGLVGDRRATRSATAAGRPRRKPIVHADKPGDLWSWDATELRGPRDQDRYALYLILDVFSRYTTGWRIEYAQDRDLAVEMFAAAFDLHGPPRALHADNGGPMRSHAMLDTLQGRGVLASFSRPRVSDDNPFSESLFKTVKYDLQCPERFDGIDHARQWTEQFLQRYNAEHRHSGIGYYTPADAYAGTVEQTRRRRQEALDDYYDKHPERFRARPAAPEPPEPTGINIPKPTSAERPTTEEPTRNLSQTG
jgi:transposase InsO family protein